MRRQGNRFLLSVAEKLVCGLHFDGQDRPVAEILRKVRREDANATTANQNTCKCSAFTGVLSAKFSSLQTSTKSKPDIVSK